MGLYPWNDCWGVGVWREQWCLSFSGLVWGKGKCLGGKSTLLSHELFFFFFFESKNISWFLVIRNMLGVFWTTAGQIPFPCEGNAGALCKESESFLKRQIKNPSFKKKTPGYRLEQAPREEGSAGGPDPSAPVPGSAAGVVALVGRATSTAGSLKPRAGDFAQNAALRWLLAGEGGLMCF